MAKSRKKSSKKKLGRGMAQKKRTRKTSAKRVQKRRVARKKVEAPTVTQQPESLAATAPEPSTGEGVPTPTSPSGGM